MNFCVNTVGLSFRCMVYGNPFYISVAAPVAAIMLANTVILVMVIFRLHKSIKNKAMNGAARVISEARIAFVCNILLGTTWILAFFAVGEATMIFQYLFCITNSLQGFFIFLFYVVQNQDARNAWLKALGKEPPSKSSTRETSGNASLNNQGKEFQVNPKLIFSKSRF